MTRYPVRKDSSRPIDPLAVARTVNAAWNARQSLAEWRASLEETPMQAMERRMERIEATLCALAERIKDVAV